MEVHPHCQDASGFPLLVGDLYQHTHWFCFDAGPDHVPTVKSCGISAHRYLGDAVCGINTNQPAGGGDEDGEPIPGTVEAFFKVMAAGSEPVIASLHQDEPVRAAVTLSFFRDRFQHRGVIQDPWGGSHPIPFDEWSRIDSDGNVVLAGFTYRPITNPPPRRLTEAEARRLGLVAAGE